MSIQPFSSDNGFITTANVDATSFNAVTSNVVVGTVKAVAGKFGASLGITSADGAADGDDGIDIDITAGGANESNATPASGGDIRIQGGYGTTSVGQIRIGAEGLGEQVVIGSPGVPVVFNDLRASGNISGPNFTNSADNVTVTANTVAWEFNTNGVLTLPGEGILRSIDDTVTLTSLNSVSGNANSVYLGTSGGLGFNDQEIGANWLEIFRNGAEPEIRVPVGQGNLNIQTAEGNSAYNWTYDNTGNLTLPGNTFAVNYANGTPVSISGGGGSYGDANVSAYLASGNNTAGYSTLGNIQVGATGGNTTALAYSSTPTQVTLSWDDLLDPFPFTAGDTVLVSGIVFPDPADLNGFWTVDSIGAKSITFNTTADPGTSTFDFSTVTVTEYTIGTLSVTGDVSANNIGNVAAVDLNGNTNTVLSGGGTWINSTITWAQLRNKDNIDAPTEIALGLLAGNAQGTSSVAIGTLAGGTGQSDYSVAVGVDSGATNQGVSSVAVGAQSGYISQGNTAVAVGTAAGYTGQGANAVAIGTYAGNSSQSTNAISIGWFAGAISQGVDTIAIGQQAGNNNQNANSVAIGAFAGTGFQAGNSVAVGTSAGSFNQGISATSVGGYAGTYNQANGAVALGGSAGFSNQGVNAVAVGYQAGNAFQGNSSIAIGTGAASINQGLQSIALGVGAGDNAQGNNAIAIGAFAGNATQPANSIMLNASGTALNGTNAGFYVAPVRANSLSASNAVFYNTGSNELTYATTKASTIAGSNTQVTLDNLTAMVGGSPTRLYIGAVTSNLTLAGDSQTMTSGSTATASWINVPVNTGAGNEFAMSGALSQNGDTVVLNIIDQGTGTGMWRVTGMIANTTANTYGVTIERLV